MTNSPLEFLASKFDNVVRYDDKGIPSIFVKFPKMTSRDLDSSLPNHTHPAFIINGQEQDYILIGKFMGNCLNRANDGRIYSQPNMPPVYGRTADEYLEKAKDFGTGASGMTIADHGFLLLLAQKKGWNPGGNTNHGHCYKDAAQKFRIGQSVTAGNRVGFRGWLYEARISHTTTAELAPDMAPVYWNRIRRIGGVEAYATLRDSDLNDIVLTTNGSGPTDWYMDGNFAGICDIAGNLNEICYGYRVVGGEIQILPDNNAADPAADLSANSAAWRAILPNTGNDGYTLVAPGTAGTMKWAWTSNKMTIGTSTTPDETAHTYRFTELVPAQGLSYVPHILKELGIFPTTGSTTAGRGNYLVSAGELLPGAGGYYGSGNYSGLGYMNFANTRANASDRFGIRPRMVWGAE